MHPQQARRPVAHEAMRARASPYARDLLGDDEIRSRFDALHHVVHRVGGIHEIAGEGDGAVALGPVGALEREAQQFLEAAGVAAAFAVRDDAERQHARVARQHLTGAVGRAVVAHQQLVLALKRRENLTDLPEDQPGGLRFVVNGNAHVDHRTGI